MVRQRYSASVMVFLSVSLLSPFLQAAHSEDPPAPSGSSSTRLSPTITDNYRSPFWPGVPYWLGIEVSPVSEVLAAQLNVQDRRGLVIDDVISDSPAQRAGLERYDVVVAVNGKAMKSFDDLQQVLQESRGKEITLDIFRAGQQKALTATPADQLKLDQRNRTQTVMPEETWEQTFSRPLAAYIIAPPELPDDVKVSIMKAGKSPVEVIVTRKEQVWKVTTDGALQKLPDDLRGPVTDFLRQSLTGATAIVEPPTSRVTGNDRSPSESILQQTLSEIVERLKAIEAKLGNDTDD